MQGISGQDLKGVTAPERLTIDVVACLQEADKSFPGSTVQELSISNHVNNLTSWEAAAQRAGHDPDQHLRTVYADISKSSDRVPVQANEKLPTWEAQGLL